MTEEKIYTTESPMTGALLGSLMNKDNDAMTALLANGGMNGMWNNPFVYLVWMMFAGRFFGNGQGQQNIEVQNQLQAIRSQLSDNQNSNLLMDAIKGNNVAIGQLASNLNCDFNALNGAICDVRGGIDRLAGQVGYSAERVINAVNLGDLNIVQQLKDCCCTTQKAIIEMGYQNQLGQKDIINTTQDGFCKMGFGVQQGFATVNTALERGFSQTAYETQKQTCDIINNQNANTQRIVDVLNSHWNDENNRKIQDLKFELSQERQNNFIAAKIAALNGGCGCGCGCN